MIYDKSLSKQAILINTILAIIFLTFTTCINANPLKPIPGEFTAVMTGVDPDTGELIFEGYKTGVLPGHLTTRTTLVQQTGVALHLATRWTLVTPWGETLKGENSAVLNTISLHFREHGIIIFATENLTERVGDFVIIHGEISDVYFIPGVTEATAQVTYVPSQAN